MFREVFEARFQVQKERKKRIRRALPYDKSYQTPEKYHPDSGIGAVVNSLKKERERHDRIVEMLDNVEGMPAKKKQKHNNLKQMKLPRLPSYNNIFFNLQCHWFVYGEHSSF